ncbi:MAG TPA: hypothetical protein VEA41_03860, partial [Salinarimonas sp.]|nr:hypothetical protein [Salinarimonas sp.]
MSTAKEQVSVEWIAKFDELKKSLGEAKGIGDDVAKALVGQLSKELRAAEKASKDAAKAAKDTKQSFDGIGDAAGTAGAGAKKLRGILGQLSPELAAAAGLVDDIGDAMEIADGAGSALGVSMGRIAAVVGGVTIALGGAYVAYRALSEEAEREAAIAAAVEQANRAITPVLEAERAAVLDLKVATGELSEEQADLVEIQTSAMDRWRASTAETRKRITELREDQESLTTTVVDGLQAWGAKWGWLGAIQTAALDGLTTDSAELQAEIDGLQGTVDRATTSTVATVKAQRQAAEAKRGHAAAARGLETTLAALAAEEEAEASLAAANLAVYNQVIASLGEAEAADRRAIMSARERADADHAAALAALDAERTRALAVTEGASAREEIERAHRAAMQAENAAYYAAVDADTAAALAKIDAMVTEHAAEQAAHLAEVREKAWGMASDLADAIATITDTVSQRQMDAVEAAQAELEALGENATKAERAQAQKRVKEAEAAALRGFGVAKGAAIASATVQAIQASLAAYVDGLSVGGPAGLILGPAMAAVAAGVGAANVAAIASSPAPSFGDTPAPMRMQGGGNVHLASGDFFAAAQSPEALRNQVGAGAPGSVYVKHRHKLFQAEVKEDLRTRGALRKATDSARPR